MKVVDNIIVEATESELFEKYLENEWFEVMDFREYLWRCQDNGTKIIKEEKKMEVVKVNALEVKINTHGNPLPECHGEWVDLALAEDVKMEKGEFKLLSLGVSMELPKGYYAEALPRSSTCKKHGIMLANSMGVIDAAYCGDNDVWQFPAYAIRDTEIPQGTRICQFRLVELPPKIKFVSVDRLGNEDRGGIGSTGD